MEMLIKCFKCGHKWYEEPEKVTRCPQCLEWQIALRMREKMTL